MEPSRGARFREFECKENDRINPNSALLQFFDKAQFAAFHNEGFAHARIQRENDESAGFGIHGFGNQLRSFR